MKEFLSQRGVPFTEKNVVEDEAAMEELSQLNLFTTPVILVDGEVVVGFDRKKLEALLDA